MSAIPYLQPGLESHCVMLGGIHLVTLGPTLSLPEKGNADITWDELIFGDSVVIDPANERIAFCKEDDWSIYTDFFADRVAEYKAWTLPGSHLQPAPQEEEDGRRKAATIQEGSEPQAR